MLISIVLIGVVAAFAAMGVALTVNSKRDFTKAGMAPPD